MIGGALQSASAIATVGFNLTGESGVLTGQTFMGQLTYDESRITGSGVESLHFHGPDNTFNVTIAGKLFTENSIVDLGIGAPELFFLDGTLTSMIYTGLSFGSPGPLAELFGGQVGNAGVGAVVGDPGAWRFNVARTDETLFTMTLKGTPVPEPGSTFALFLLGLAGLRLAGLRRRLGNS